MLKKRQPIVTVLGHVDHGKTSLLDALRETSVALKEAGGITQSIGASEITFTSEDGQNKSVCFIDTPGHALFSGMRIRGANVADIALLVIDGSSGIKPQTLEALDIIQKNEIPYIVVVTKCDLPSSTIENVLPQLEEKGIYFEGRGGQTPFVEVSAKNKINLDKLLDLILLFAEVNEISSDEDLPLEAYVIETTKEKAGVSVSVVVKNGKITVGKDLYTNITKGRVKGLFNTLNNQIKEVLPGFPARILGFEDMPEVGGLVTDSPVQTKLKENIKNFVRHDTTKIPIVVKSSNQGSLEALIASIPEGFVVVDSGVGDVLESDVLNARASDAHIFAFESKASGSVKKLADSEGVVLETYDVVYKLLEKLELILKGEVLNIIGKAEILAEFPYNDTRVAGSKVLIGRIEKSFDTRLLRGEKELGKIKITSIKKQKQEVNGVSQGEECGILFTPQLDFKIGDVIIAVGK